MSNIVIGILSKTDDKDVNEIINKNNLKYLHNKCTYIGILNYDNYSEIDIDALKLCDGIIIPGGTIVYPYHYQVVDYCFNNNVPLLGICLGNQIIGLYNLSQDDMDLLTVDNHYLLDHNINIDKSSTLYKIFGENIKVNSRHHFALKEVKLPFKVVAKSDDNIIEAIELIDDKHFILGVQWHPEDMNNMENLYNTFVSEILKRKQNRI